MFAPAYAVGTVLGGANSRRAAAFRALAPGFLGMDGRGSSVLILLCRRFPNSAEWNPGSAPRTVSARGSRTSRRGSCAARPRTTLRPVTFRYKKEIDPNGISHFGLVAEDGKSES